VVAVALILLALATGATTAVFSLVNAVYLKTLPIGDPARFVRLTGDPWFSIRVWEHIRDHQLVFERVAAAGTDRFNLARGGLVKYAAGLVVSGEFFNVTRIAPALGRFFGPSDDAAGAAAVAVISHAMWQREFGSRPHAIGSTIWLDGAPFEIVGIAPQGFVGVEVGRSVDVILPIASLATIPSRAALLQPNAVWLHVFARLEPGQSTGEATAALRVWQPALAAATRPAPAPVGPDPAQHLVRPLAVSAAATGISELRVQFGPAMLMLFGLVGAVSLVAFANLAAISLARFVDRQPDLAVRRALGAATSDLVRTVLFEHAMLVLAGALLGGWLASMATRTAVPYLTSPAFRSVSPYLDVSPDWRVFALIALLILVATLVAAVVPILRVIRVPLAPRDAERRTVASSRSAIRAMRVLLTAQLALSLALVGAALLLGRSFYELTSQEIGIDTDRVEIVTVSGDFGTGRGAPLSAIEEIRARLQAVPGVEAVAASIVTPVSGQMAMASISMPGSPPPGDADGRVLANRVSPDHFRVYGTALVFGRDFDGRDTAESTPVAIVNRAFARRYFDGHDPVGRTILLNKRTATIVGLVADAKQLTLRDPPPAFLYAPISQLPSTTLSSVRFGLRRLPPGPAASVLADAIKPLNPDWSVEIRPLAADVDRSVNVERLLASCGGLFAALAILMGIVGTSGVFSYSVAHRSHDAGVRLVCGWRWGPGLARSCV
jgi:predicted permease